MLLSGAALALQGRANPGTGAGVGVNKGTSKRQAEVLLRGEHCKALEDGHAPEESKKGVLEKS